MIRPTTLLLLLIIIIASACRKRNSPPPPDKEGPTSLLNLKIDISYSTLQSDDWVMVHDTNGKLIEYKAFETGDIVKLETTKAIAENKINVTLLHYTRNNGSENYILKSYLNNDISQEWTLKKEKELLHPISNVIGSITVIVDGIPTGSAYQFSDKSLSQIFGFGTWDGGSNKLSNTLPIYQNNEAYLFYMADNRGIPKYKFLKNVKNNDVFNFSYQEMNNFNHIVKTTFPPTKINKINYLVNSVEEGQENFKIGYLTNCNLSHTNYSDHDIRSEISLGYLDTFSVYNTALFVAYDSLKYGYEKLGTRPEAINFPVTSKFTLNNRNIANFDFTHNQPFVRRNSSWLYIDNASSPRLLIDWVVEAPAQGSQKFTELPSEFVTKYPTLSLDKLKHSSSVFLTHGAPYTEVINTTFKGKEKSKNFENYIIEVN